MTIVASVKVRDGLVLGTDSMTQIWGPHGYEKSYANARKLFRLGEHPVGVMTHGLGNIGNRSIEGIVIDFCQTLEDDEYTVAALSQALFEYVVALYEVRFHGVPDEDRQALGFYVAGYSPGAAMAEEYEFILPRDGAPVIVRPQDEPGASWRGISAPLTALMRGIAPGFRQALIADHGIVEDDLNALSDDHGTSISLAGMPVQDAVDLATYLLDVTIGWAHFQIGVDSCARPIQMAVVHATQDWEWVAKPVLTVR
jgi:hypothetical protein